MFEERGERRDVFEEQGARRDVLCVTATNRAGNAWCLDGDRMPECGKACTVSLREDEEGKERMVEGGGTCLERRGEREGGWNRKS